MATKKKAAKPAPKKPAPKAAVKAVKKPAPAPKKAAPAAKKPVKLAVAKSAVKSKPVVKAPAKKVVKPAPKPTTKTVVKSAAKSAPKATPAASKIATPIKTVKNLPKPVVTPAPKKPVAETKPVQQPMAKKVKETKSAPQLAAPTVAAAPVKEAAKPMVSGKATAKNVKDIKVIPPKPVVLPKINTKTSRTYQPDFTKSVLDQPLPEQNKTLIRYNDTDLTEFRELIQRKLEAAKKELNYLQGLITRKDEMGGDESENRYMTMEDGSLSMEREQLSQMASRQITFIDHLEKALMRIENKTYGICRITGKLIDKARLRAVPHATLSIEAKMGNNK